MPKQILKQMFDEEPHENWNYNEFIGLLLVYAGWSDGDFSDDEKEYVISKVGTENYSKAVEYLKETDDLDQVTMLMILFEHYASDQQSLLCSVKSWL